MLIFLGLARRFGFESSSFYILFLIFLFLLLPPLGSTAAFFFFAQFMSASDSPVYCQSMERRFLFRTFEFLPDLHIAPPVPSVLVDQVDR